MPELLQKDELGNILSKHFLNEFRTGYIESSGHLMPEFFETISDDIKNLNIYNDDIWVCSFPKTGRIF